MAAERNKQRSRKLLVTGGPVLACCKKPLTRTALSCLYFLKTKSEQHIAICSDTPAQLQREECVRVLYPQSRTKLLSTAFKQWRSSAMEMSEQRFSQGTPESSHETGTN